MKRALIAFLLCCSVPIMANAADIFNFNDSFNLAKAVKLGRGSAYSVSTSSNLNTGTGKTEIAEKAECDANCSKCDTATGTCSSCKSGRYLSDNLCLLCQKDDIADKASSANQNVTKCAAFGTTSDGECNCLSCKPGYVDSTYPSNHPMVLDGAKISIPTAYCVNCPANGTCDGSRNVTCADGYYHGMGHQQTSWAITHLCIACPDGCATCSSDDGVSPVCTTCQSGYALKDGKCVSASCSTDEVWGDVNNGKCAVFGLNSEGICACLQCKAGYVDASYPAGQGPDIGTTYCIACPENGTCDGTRNVTCDAGYTHISVGQTPYAMGHRCEKTTCPAGYFTSLRTGECVQSQCYPNRYLGENECLNYEGCKKCFYNSSCPGWQCQDDLGTLGSATTSCSAGKYLSNGTCVDCPAGTYSKGGTVTSCTSCTTLYTSAGSNTCTSCTTTGTCTGSNGGSSSSSGSSSSCTPTTGYTCVNGVKTKCMYEGCASCATDTLKCISCKSGYAYTAGSNCSS